MDTAVDPGVIDIIRNLLPRGVIENHARRVWAGQRDRVAALTIDVLEHLTSGARRARMVRRITGERRCDYERQPIWVWIGLLVAICIAGPDRCHWPPGVVVI